VLWRFVLVDRPRAPTPQTDALPARSRDGLYDTALAESEREAVAELLGYLENVPTQPAITWTFHILIVCREPKLTSSPANR